MKTKPYNKIHKALLITLTLFAVILETAAEKRPNILLMMTDDQGWADLGYRGHPYLKTPNLDRLASQSTELVQFTTPPNCAPTRAGLMTGRYNYRTGVTEVLGGNHMMYSDEVTIAEVLRDAGYRTGIFGKWHLGSNYPMRPTDQGFEEALVHKAGGIGQAAGPAGNQYFDPTLEHNDVTKQYSGYCDDIFADAAIGFIEQKSDKPFFAYLATPLPHFPLVVGDEWADPYREMGLHEHNALTFGMIAAIDWNVGRVLEAIKRSGIENNTIVIFMSDNGPRTRRTKNDVYPGRFVAGLRGTKTSIYDNGIRVPFFIRWPDRLKAGVKIDTIAAHIDVFPTLLDACGIEVPSEITIDGWSLMPLLSGEAESWPQRNLYFQWHGGPIPYEYVHFAVRSDRYKLVQGQDDPHGFYDRPSRDQLKQILAGLELYDIRNDPSEIHNLAKQHPEIVDQMLADYEDWFSDVTSGRDFHFQERTHLGTPHQSTVILSLFDNRQWKRGPGGGYWDVLTPESGSYEFRLQFNSAGRAGTAVIRYAGQSYSKPFAEGVREVTFTDVFLPEASGRLEVFLKKGRISEPVDYVDVTRMD